MRGAARIQAAIECLDAALQGAPLEAVLTQWARGHRFAGSKDRAAIRDHAYQAWRCRRSYSWLGGAADQPTGRALMLGMMRETGQDLDGLFSGERHAPARMTEAERAPPPPLPDAVAADIPDWQIPLWQRRFGPAWPDQARALRQRASPHLRVNLAVTDRAAAQARLAEAGITTQAVTGVETALAVTSGARRVHDSDAFRAGWVELQDAASQALAAALPLPEGARVLDYCAGGGGKSLALAARPERPSVTAHDARPARMTDLGPRSQRTGCTVERSDQTGLQGRVFDLVLCDSPCSGSGSWRRDPDGKWALTPAKLQQLIALQRQILVEAAQYVRPGGTLAHATCSVFEEENRDVVNHFFNQCTDFQLMRKQEWPIDNPSDGFGLILLKRRRH